LSDSVSVYIHVPFCLKKCSYCDFYSTGTLSFLPAYVKGLQQEIEIRGKAKKKARTIYFGGGTPSLLPLEDVEKILETIRVCYRVSGNAEVTFEVNPGTVDESYLSGLKKLGVNRLSIGVQSFDPGKISVLGRIHTVDQSIGAIGAAESAGFENIGFDLIYGTPGETPKTWIRDLKTALGFKAAHLSCYMLTLEPGTPLAARYEEGLFQAPGPDLLTDLFTTTAVFLEQQGYEHYEISNFARGRKNRSRHNSNYWKMTPYDGFGPSAHSLGFPGETDPASPVRSWNLADVNA
jgi:oxygen-independent coproporphyrinogen-3 oxidase